MCCTCEIKIVYKETTIIEINFIKHKKSSEVPQSFKKAISFEYMQEYYLKLSL